MELIDKKPLLRSLVDWQMSNFTKVGHEREYNLLDSIIKGIENAPTVEAKEVAHGKWIYGKNHGEFVEAECSACNGLLLVKWYDKLSEYNYCPNCGCDMRTSAE